MFSNYIFVHNLISFKNCKIVSPATFVNKLDVTLTLADECQQHLRSRDNPISNCSIRHTNFKSFTLKYL
jgi:hypothetical protein